MLGMVYSAVSATPAEPFHSFSEVTPRAARSPRFLYRLQLAFLCQYHLSEQAPIVLRVVPNRFRLPSVLQRFALQRAISGRRSHAIMISSG